MRKHIEIAISLKSGHIARISGEKKKIQIGKRFVSLILHEFYAAFNGSWSVSCCHTGSRVGFGESRAAAVADAKRKITAVGYADYWAAIRKFKKDVLGGKSIEKANSVSLPRYEKMINSRMIRKIRKKACAA